MSALDNKYDDLSFDKLLGLFLAGSFDLDPEESAKAGAAVHNKLRSAGGIESLIPMFESKNEICIFAAAYIASEEDIRAMPIFESHLIDMLKHPSPSVRDEIVSCFVSCASYGHHFESLFNCLLDTHQPIRVKLLEVLSSTSSEKIEICSSYLDQKKSRTWLLDGLNLLQRDIDLDGFYEASNIEKKFFYINYLRRENILKEMPEVVNMFNDEDILRHCDIYKGFHCKRR